MATLIYLGAIVATFLVFVLVAALVAVVGRGK